MALVLARGDSRCRSVGYIGEVSGRVRIVLVACWVIVAGLLVRMASGGNALGILYVVRVNDPATLLVGAFSVLVAGGVAVRILTAPSRRTLWASTGLSLLIIPFSLVLAGDGHDSAGALGAAAVVALAIGIQSLGRSREPVMSGAITPSATDAGDH